MKKLVFIFCLSMVSLSLLNLTTACTKNKVVKGCTDATSTNYNPDANENDGTCKYVADAYVGNYTVVDSIFFSNIFTNANTYNFSISKKTATQITFQGFAGCTIDANVTSSSIALIDNGTCNIYNYSGSFNNNIITSHHTMSGSGATVRSKATKQP